MKLMAIPAISAHYHSATCGRRLLIALLLLSAASTAIALQPSDIPPFRIRIRVVSVGGKEPKGHKFPIRLQTLSGEADGKDWSPWLIYDAAQVSKSLAHSSPYLTGWPLVLSLQMGGVLDPTLVQAELSLDESGKLVPLEWNLFGPNMGLLLWREAPDKSAHAATMAVYNRRYWNDMHDVQIPEKARPRSFVLVDRFIGGDDDRIDWKEGFENLARAGFSAIMTPGNPP